MLIIATHGSLLDQYFSSTASQIDQKWNPLLYYFTIIFTIYGYKAIRVSSSEFILCIYSVEATTVSNGKMQFSINFELVSSRLNIQFRRTLQFISKIIANFKDSINFKFLIRQQFFFLLMNWILIIWSFLVKVFEIDSWISRDGKSSLTDSKQSSLFSEGLVGQCLLLFLLKVC